MRWIPSFRFGFGWNHALALLLAASLSAVNLGAQQPQQRLNDYFKQAQRP